MIPGVLTQTRFTVGPCSHPVGISQFQNAQLDRHTQPLAGPPPRSPDLWNDSYYDGEDKWRPLHLPPPGKSVNGKQHCIPRGTEEVGVTIKDLKDAVR